MRNFRIDLPEQFQSLSLQVRRNRGQSSEISTRPSEARDKTRSDGVANGRHDKRDSHHRSLDRERRGRTGRDDNVHIERDELGNEFRKSLILSFRPSVLDDDVSTLDVAEVTQSLAERPNEIGL